MGTTCRQWAAVLTLLVWPTAPQGLESLLVSEVNPFGEDRHACVHGSKIKEETSCLCCHPVTMVLQGKWCIVAIEPNAS